MFNPMIGKSNTDRRCSLFKAADELRLHFKMPLAPIPQRPGTQNIFGGIVHCRTTEHGTRYAKDEQSKAELIRFFSAYTSPDSLDSSWAGDTVTDVHVDDRADICIDTEERLIPSIQQWDDRYPRFTSRVPLWREYCERFPSIYPCHTFRDVTELLKRAVTDEVPYDFGEVVPMLVAYQRELRKFAPKKPRIVPRGAFSRNDGSVPDLPKFTPGS